MSGALNASLKTASVALVGNPNTGKTTLFNALTGLRHRVANYPGVTVELKSGIWRLPGLEVELLDLPGTYSLRPRSADEAVVLNALSGKIPNRYRPDVAVVVLDASNLERNLYLLSQVYETGLPVVVALNMGDVAEAKGIETDVETMSRQLGTPVVAIQANKRVGLERLAAETEKMLQQPFPPRVGKPHLEELPMGSSEDIKSHYRWIRQVLDGVQKKPVQPVETPSDRIDHFLTHKIFGTLIFLLLMGAMFQSIFSWSKPLMDGINQLVSFLGQQIGARLPEGMLKSLLVDGALAGVGSVVVFLPQIAILFLFIGILEDCGYMARTAFLMDKLLARAGLSGKSFIPMLSSFACAVPGIMATRTIENWKDRVVTMVVSPLMSCSARLPVYIIFISAFVPERTYLGFLHLQTLCLLGLYLLGVAVAVPVVWLLKKFWLKGETPVFIMELPSYKWPDWSTIFSRVWKQAQAFLVRAGTLIFSVSILVWALSYFPHRTATVSQSLAAASVGPDGMDASAVEAGEQLRASYIGNLGRLVEPIFKPLGWDWRISMAAIASFPAREVVVATLGTIFNLSSKDKGEDYEGLGKVLQHATWPDGSPLFTLATAFSIMVFFALCCQCASTLSVMRQETGGWTWPAFTFAYMTVLAYFSAMATYQILHRIL